MVREEDVTVEEDIWWRSLEGEDLEVNTAGVPPYDVEAVAHYINERLGKVGLVLDYGCGTGRLTEAYMDISRSEVDGFDISERALDAASAWLHHGGFMPRNAWPPGAYDGAYCVAVFQHLPADEVEHALRRIALGLKPGARLVFQFVAGTEDAFLSHQMEEVAMLVLCERAGLIVESVAGWLHPKWRWVTAVAP